MVLVVIDDGKTFVLLEGYKDPKPHLCHAEQHYPMPLRTSFGLLKQRGQSDERRNEWQPDRASKRAEAFGCTDKSEMVERVAQLSAVVHQVVCAIHGDVVAARLLASSQNGLSEIGPHPFREVYFYS